MDTGIAVEIGPFSIHWYGILIVLGVLVGAYVASVEAKRRGEDPEHVWNALTLCVILGVIGARLYHVVSTPADGSGGVNRYLEEPIAILRIWDGGLGIYGALLGGVLAVLIYAWRHNLSPLRWMDFGAPGLILAQAVGRWGNFINQELYGPPTDLPWGLKIEAENRIPKYSNLSQYPVETTRFHPTFLYESLWNLASFGAMMWVGRRFENRLRDGDILFLYMALYGLGRTWIETFFRPDAWVVGQGGPPMATVISLGLMFFGVLMIVWRHRGWQPEGQDAAPEEG